ncbi:hypothetical protein BH23ACT10_BH23ACT10_37970 [soil metagenome]
MNAGQARSAGELRVAVEPDTVDVAPGAEEAVELRVGSTAATPQEVVLVPIGPQAAWCTVTPQRARVEPHADVRATVTVRVPERSPLPPQPIVIGLRATAADATVLPHVGELRVSVAVTVALQLDVAPPVQRVSGRAKFAAVVRNDGTVPLQVQLTSGDAPPLLRVRVRPAAVTVVPNGRARATVSVAAPAPWTGDEPEHSFTVRAVASSEQIEALGSVVQRTRAGTGLLALAGCLVVAAILALVVLVGGVV